MDVSSHYWSPFHGNDCVFSRNEQQKVSYVSMATGVILNQSKNFELIRFTQNPVIIFAHKFAHD